MTFGGLYGFSNQAGSFPNNRSYSFGAQYVQGPLSVAAAYMQINNPGGTSGGSLATNDTAFIAARERVWGAGVNYVIGAATTVGVVYLHTDLTSATSSVYVGNSANTASSLKFDNLEANIKSVHAERVRRRDVHLHARPLQQHRGEFRT